MARKARMPQGEHASTVNWTASLKLRPSELREARRRGWLRRGLKGWTVDVDAKAGVVTFRPKPNLVVDAGVQRALDRLFNRNGPPSAVITMGVDDGTTNPVAGSTSSSASSTARRLVAFDATPGRTGNVISCQGTFTNGNVSFVMKRLFLSAAAAGTSDAAGDLYSMTNVFTIDLTAFSVWTMVFTATVTGTGS